MNREELKEQIIDILACSTYWQMNDATGKIIGLVLSTQPTKEQVIEAVLKVAACAGVGHGSVHTVDVVKAIEKLYGDGE